MQFIQGSLYVVATPIGHLDDITHRAIEILNSVDLIAAEDTRHSQKLLNHFNIRKPLVALHEHNEREEASQLLDKIATGTTVALISDAGTPLISDPGYHLVRLAQDRNIRVIPVPGASAVIAALSASGLPTDRFIFEGFLPAKTAAKQKRLEGLAGEERTLIFFEAPHRVLETLQTLVKIFGSERRAVLARELTKTFETIKSGTLLELSEFVRLDSAQQRGEIVILVEGVHKTSQKIADQILTPEAENILKILLKELSVKQASSLAAEITGINKRLLYDLAVKLKR